MDFTEEHVLRYLPDGPWRIVRSNGQTFLVRRDTISAIYGQDLKALVKECLDDADAARMCDNKNTSLLCSSR